MRYYAGLPHIAGRPVSSVYWGGGTPTLYDAEDLARIATELKNLFSVAAGTEWSIEANPRTISEDKLHAYGEMGVNRISLGAQSFDDDLLKLIGRRHTAAEIEDAVSLIKSSGIANVNLDLIFGIPTQTLSCYEESLSRAIALSVQHLSLYGLQLEEGTVLTRWVEEGVYPAMDEQLELAMLYRGEELLRAAGYDHYEISNFALPDRECRHNLAYWKHNEYLGLGAGAFSYLEGIRFSHISSPYAFISAWQEKGSPSVEEEEEITPKLQQAETLMLGFRMMSGIDIADFERRFSLSFRERYGEVVDGLLDEGLIEQQGTRLLPTHLGLALNNRIAAAFL